MMGGRGTPVVLLHGFPETWMAWRKVMPALADEHTVVAVDLRGAGESALEKGGYDKETLAADVHQLVERLGLRRRVAGGGRTSVARWRTPTPARTRNKCVAWRSWRQECPASGWSLPSLRALRLKDMTGGFRRLCPPVWGSPRIAEVDVTSSDDMVAGMPASEPLTVDELARRAGTTTRNVRNYQTLGLLPPPTMAGRVGHYDEGHLARLRVIARLQDQGFSLSAIDALLQAWEDGRGLAEVLGFEQVLTAPWNEEPPEVVSIEELLALFPGAGEDPALAARAVELGLLVPEGDSFRLPSPSLVRAGAELVDVGVPLAATQDEVAALRGDMARVAARFVALFERYVWEPFAAAGMPAERLPDVTDALRRLRPLAAIAVKATLAHAMEEAVAASTALQSGAAQADLYTQADIDPQPEGAAR
jgi:DNA-binding transcriptional MerR regulator